jgi:predicted Fe-Mo cluster-binding NifX family protein
MDTGADIRKVAVTIWDERISPVFDASSRLLVAEIDHHNSIAGGSTVLFNPAMPSHLASTLQQMRVPVLICGAVSRVPANLITAGGIELIPFITGRWEEVLKAYAQGRSLVPDFVMPGCGKTSAGGGKCHDRDT